MAEPAAALTIAGLDPTGGAGIALDLAVFAAHRVPGACVLTASTVQTRRAIARVDPVDPSILAAQLAAVFADRPVGAVKIGMLATEANVAAVAEFLAGLPHRPPIVLDPVMSATAGGALLSAEAVASVRERLLPLVTLATPNRAEAARLEAPPGCPVLLTGGDTPEDGRVHDDLWLEGSLVRRFSGTRIGTRQFHGTGCALSSAIAARLARGEPLELAIEAAIQWVRTLVVAADRTAADADATAVLAPALVPA